MYLACFLGVFQCYFNVNLSNPLFSMGHGHTPVFSTYRGVERDSRLGFASANLKIPTPPFRMK